MKHTRPTSEYAPGPRRKRRAHAEAEAGEAAAQHPLIALQGAAGNAAVERAVVQRKKSATKPPAGVTTIVAPTRSSYDVTATTLSEAAAQIEARDEAGETTWAQSLDLTTDENGRVTAAKVEVTINIEMPSWPGAAKLGRRASAEWQRASGALERHEQGHVALVRKHLGGVAQRLVGKSEGEAQRIFQAALDALQKASDAYDTKTDHGRKLGTEINLSAEDDE